MPSRRIDAVAARALVAEARLNEAGTIEASELGKLTEALIGDVATMIEAVAATMLVRQSRRRTGSPPLG